jgi:hypothetical protein
MKLKMEKYWIISAKHKAAFLENTSKTDKPPARLTESKREDKNEVGFDMDSQTPKAQ